MTPAATTAAAIVTAAVIVTAAAIATGVSSRPIAGYHLTIAPPPPPADNPPMHPTMLDRLTHRWTIWVVRHWVWVIATWVVLAIGLRVAAPSWRDIAYDGDFEYLPADRVSVAGGRVLDEAFPGERGRSQIVFVLARDDGDLTKSDEIIGLDLLRRLYHRLAEVSWQRAIKLGYVDGPIDPQMPYAAWLELTRAALDESIAADDAFYQRIADQVPDVAATPTEPRMAIAFWDRSILNERLRQPDELIDNDREAALVICPDLASSAVPIGQRDLTSWSSLIDVLSWTDSVIGRRLQSPAARLTVGQLGTELAATSNIATFESAMQLVHETATYSGRFTKPGVRLKLTGSAAIGGETLMAARDAIAYTEWFTFGLIVLILAVVYRSPLLVAIPMLSIGVALVCSISLVSLLTSQSISGGFPWIDLRIFTTSRIFVVVILYGAGIDYCLFYIARLREEAASLPWAEACHHALHKVSGALFGSALTTIVGLGMLWIADFGKFHYTGPIIAICLSVGLLVCLTLTPALLRGLGPIALWPNRIEPVEQPVGMSLLGVSTRHSTVGAGVWGWIAVQITRRPVTSLILGVLLLATPAVYGYRNEDHVSYDFSGQLGLRSESRQGMALLREHFDIGEINPLTLTMISPRDLTREQLEEQAKQLRDELYRLGGVIAVRTIDDPLGSYPPGRETGLLNKEGLLRRALRNHRIAQGHFFSDVPRYADRLLRMDVVMVGNPFDRQTATLVQQISDSMQRRVADESSNWFGYSTYLTGSTPSIIDLRDVTLSDNRRIKIAVTLSVLAVLYVVIRRLGLCVYLIGTVLLSYYATLGLTFLFFEWLHGDEFLGLDWKLPLFLFVILIAVGQDYNVYLVTRIMEEQRTLGWLSALRRAVSRTGGIITACGLVMAATFLSMTASAWFPWLQHLWSDTPPPTMTLQGVVELGFALGLGVLIDTFYVRTILVPTYFALIGRDA